MLSALSLILYKEFHVSPFILTFLVALKPVSALFSTYLSSWIYNGKKNLVCSLALINCLRFVPFLGLFWHTSPWTLVFAFGWYMVLSRACAPAWIELFKHNLPQEHRSKILSLGNMLEYLGSTLLPLLLGVVLDIWDQSWQLLFPLTAVFGMLSTIFLFRIPPHLNLLKDNENDPLTRPWRRAFKLIREYPDFRRYLLGFMLGGSGLMILQPALPALFVDHLHLSYTEIMLALAVCKGIGYTLASPLWTRLFNRLNLFTFSAFVTILAVIFPLLIFFANWSLVALYLAYLSYGMMQAGSEMSWHLSALTFSREKESLPFSETNILAVGLRGCVIPLLGGILVVNCSIVVVLLCSFLLCTAGMIVLAKTPSSLANAASE
ncbi:MAG: MFS transporter [Verrucomicrobia bacterium]|nr:MFS transporter [Verrucomicrobiota bacterium]